MQTTAEGPKVRAGLTPHPVKAARGDLEKV